MKNNYLSQHSHGENAKGLFVSHASYSMSTNYDRKITEMQHLCSKEAESNYSVQVKSFRINMLSLVPYPKMIPQLREKKKKKKKRRTHYI